MPIHKNTVMTTTVLTPTYSHSKFKKGTKNI
uniref:Uncharacterized protein n=1 Tax=Setaria italica TaxID=4555 RepID=K3Z284_SETIT